jgi:predicted cupin superfamily sugar epimerase
MDPRAETLIKTLAVAPHPEGGYFREVYRSTVRVDPVDGRGARTALTVIYFLRAEGQVSRWHRVRSDEVWQFVEGSPLELMVTKSGEMNIGRVKLDSIENGGPAIHVVPAGSWQAARPLGGYTLVTCTVGPGFEFEDFELMAARPDEVARLEAKAPEVRGLV